MHKEGEMEKCDGRVDRIGIFLVTLFIICFFFFKQKTAYEIYQCDWSSDVCSSDLANYSLALGRPQVVGKRRASVRIIPSRDRCSAKGDGPAI